MRKTKKIDFKKIELETSREINGEPLTASLNILKVQFQLIEFGDYETIKLLEKVKRRILRKSGLKIRDFDDHVMQAILNYVEDNPKEIHD